MFGISEAHWHPLVVHFPITLWCTATFFYILAFLGVFAFLRRASIWMGLLGSLLGFVATWTGDKAAAALGANLCENTTELLIRHSDQAETALIFMSVAWALAALQEYVLSRYLGRLSHFRVVSIFAAVAMLLGTLFLVKAGHKGFELVYQHGVGVQDFVPKCR
jgi:uncharacterized membrane protein